MLAAARRVSCYRPAKAPRALTALCFTSALSAAVSRSPWTKVGLGRNAFQLSFLESRPRLGLPVVRMAATASDAGADAGGDAEVAAAQGPGNDELRDLWATSFEGWVGPPGAESQVVYLKPVDEGEAAAEEGEVQSPEFASLEPALELADQWGGVFGVTAFNPMGQDREHGENMAKNELLKAEIESLCARVDGRWWPSFGFAGDWHEKGFTVAAPQDEVIKLAKDFGQGAVFRFYRAAPSAARGAPVMRETVPALIADTEADVPMVPAARPAISRADPEWAPADEADS